MPRKNPKNALNQAARPTIRLVNEVASSGIIQKARKKKERNERKKEKEIGKEARLKEQTIPACALRSKNRKSPIKNKNSYDITPENSALRKRYTNPQPERKRPRRPLGGKRQRKETEIFLVDHNKARKYPAPRAPPGPCNGRSEIRRNNAAKRTKTATHRQEKTPHVQRPTGKRPAQ